MSAAKTATEKWEGNLPLNLKELADAQCVSYKTAVRWASDLSFPRVGRLVRPQDFLRWWKDRASHPSKASHHPRSADCKPREQSLTSDSLTALPPRAARLRDAIASHS